MEVKIVFNDSPVVGAQVFLDGTDSNSKVTSGDALIFERVKPGWHRVEAVKYPEFKMCTSDRRRLKPGGMLVFTVPMVREICKLEVKSEQPGVRFTLTGPVQLKGTTGTLDAVFDSMRAPPLATAWPAFVQAWGLIYAATKHTCMAPTPRWVVTQTPLEGPWGGRAICAPTLAPQSQLVRTYASRGECDMALQLLDPQEPAVAITDTVQCGEAGCDQVISWGPRPTR